MRLWSGAVQSGQINDLFTVWIRLQDKRSRAIMAMQAWNGQERRGMERNGKAGMERKEIQPLFSL